MLANEEPPQNPTPLSTQTPTREQVMELARQLSDLQTRQNQVRSGFSANQPALSEKGPLRFVITDSPSDSNMSNHLQDLKKLNVRHVCRASEATYSPEPLTKSGIKVHDLAFPDGDPPPDSVLQSWLKLVEQCFIKRFRSAKVKGVNSEDLQDLLKKDERISVHCVAGLGRAPVLVAVALVEFCQLDPIEAVNFIRKHRRGAINKKQLKWLEGYVPRKHGAFSACACVIC